MHIAVTLEGEGREKAGHVGCRLRDDPVDTALAVISSAYRTLGIAPMERPAVLTRSHPMDGTYVAVTVPPPASAPRGTAKMAVADAMAAIRDVLASDGGNLWDGEPVLLARYSRDNASHAVGLADADQRPCGGLSAAQQMAVVQILCRTRPNAEHDLGRSMPRCVRQHLALEPLRSATLAAAMRARAPGRGSGRPS